MKKLPGTIIAGALVSIIGIALSYMSLVTLLRDKKIEIRGGERKSMFRLKQEVF